MTRKNRDYTRDILPDPKYGDVVLTKTINCIMQSGKKGVAERAVYDALQQVADKGQDSMETFHKALSNIKPSVEVRSRRVGGATYQVPTEVRPVRAQALAIRWLIQAANSRSERKLALRLAGEILDASQNRGVAVKKREDTHRMADANKAFAHFKW
jgi:small subunit ribosomal protein S7